MRSAILPAFALMAACTAFSAAPATEPSDPSSAGDARDATNAAPPDGAAPDAASARFCAGHPGVLLCEDFEDGYATAWRSLPLEASGTPSMMRRVFEGGDHGTVALIDVNEEPGRKDDNADLHAGPPAGTYALSFSLRVDQIEDDQYVEVTSIKTQGGSDVAFHVELMGQSVRINEFIDGSSYRTELGHVTIGQWHRVEVEFTFGPENRIAGALDGVSQGPILWEKHATDSITGNVRMIAGLHFLAEWKAPFRYAIDDILLEKRP